MDYVIDINNAMREVRCYESQSLLSFILGEEIATEAISVEMSTKSPFQAFKEMIVNFFKNIYKAIRNWIIKLFGYNNASLMHRNASYYILATFKKWKVMIERLLSKAIQHKFDRSSASAISDAVKNIQTECNSLNISVRKMIINDVGPDNYISLSKSEFNEILTTNRYFEDVTNRLLQVAERDSTKFKRFPLFGKNLEEIITNIITCIGNIDSTVLQMVDMCKYENRTKLKNPSIKSSNYSIDLTM